MVDHKAALLARLRQPYLLHAAPPGMPGVQKRPTHPAPVRDAATVVLLRDHPHGRGIEAYLLKRTSTMAFAAGMYVFPGGRVDPADARETPPWVGPPADEVMHALDADPALAQALVCAAVRETFEECGILLAAPADMSPTPTAMGSLDSPEWIALRRSLERQETHLAELLTRLSLALRADLLAPWARWVTPEVEPRRYDTRFFVAALPDGQRPGQISGEADRMVWMRPADALEKYEAGTMTMLPPTAFTLAELCSYEDVASVLAAAHVRDLSPIMPRILVSGDEAQLLLPHDEGYHDTTGHAGTAAEHGGGG